MSRFIEYFLNMDTKKKLSKLTNKLGWREYYFCCVQIAIHRLLLHCSLKAKELFASHVIIHHCKSFPPVFFGAQGNSGNA